MKSLADLTKFGIVIFVWLSALAGYGLGFRIEQTFSPLHLLQLLVGIGFLSAGSFALNQFQESDIDELMPRTRKRPIPSGQIPLWAAFGVAMVLICGGSFILYEMSPLVGFLGLFTVFLYNVCYTIYWKRTMPMAAVPGAIPGAMPVVIGYAANSSNIFSTECIYAFLIMFLWQMPHYWSLALRFEDDYRKGGVPTLPVSSGTDTTLFHMGIYTLAYVALALVSPWFVEARYFYALIVIPFSFKILWEFSRYFRNRATRESWLPFFLWTNFSMLAFLVVPVMDKWFVVISNIQFS
ncbi:MAG: heme o synthase [Bdellovibrionia bacterium]